MIYNFLRRWNELKEMLIRLYELNERYHDTKEKMAWLATSLYATFSVAIIRILFIEKTQNFIKNCRCNTILICAFLSVVCGCAVWFIHLQYRKKRISVAINGEFMEILPEQTLSDENKLTRMLECTREINKCWRNYKKEHKKKSKCRNKLTLTEGPVFTLIGIFFVTQILITLILGDMLCLSKSGKILMFFFEMC